MKIRFCDNNSGKGATLRKLTEEFPAANIKTNKCIKQCSVCRELPVATIDKEKFTARNWDELYSKLAAKISASE